ncbi:hypothetical protein M2351_006461 [Azospirillum canadense]|nr:hypothetical protein [Azospirillum canadense]
MALTGGPSASGRAALAEPLTRQAGIKVADVAPLVDKLKNDARVI